MGIRVREGNWMGNKIYVGNKSLEYFSFYHIRFIQINQINIYMKEAFYTSCEKTLVIYHCILQGLSQQWASLFYCKHQPVYLMVQIQYQRCMS